AQRRCHVTWPPCPLRFGRLSVELEARSRGAGEHPCHHAISDELFPYRMAAYTQRRPAGQSAGWRPALWEDLHSLDGGGRSGRLPRDAQLGVDIGEVPLDRPLAEVKRGGYL